MKGMISDPAAISFTREFYKELGFGEIFESAFRKASIIVRLPLLSTVKQDYSRRERSWSVRKRSKKKRMRQRALVDGWGVCWVGAEMPPRLIW